MEDTYFNRGPHFIIGPLQMRFGYLVVILIYNAGKRTHDGHEAGQLCVPNIRFGMDAENRRGKFAT
jgi:hypothetical protein